MSGSVGCQAWHILRHTGLGSKANGLLGTCCGEKRLAFCLSTRGTWRVWVRQLCAFHNLIQKTTSFLYLQSSPSYFNEKPSVWQGWDLHQKGSRLCLPNTWLLIKSIVTRLKTRLWFIPNNALRKSYFVCLVKHFIVLRLASLLKIPLLRSLA